jgi:hypothetical protein
VRRRAARSRAPPPLTVATTDLAWCASTVAMVTLGSAGRYRRRPDVGDYHRRTGAGRHASSWPARRNRSMCSSPPERPTRYTTPAPRVGACRTAPNRPSAEKAPAASTLSPSGPGAYLDLRALVRSPERPESGVC